MDNKQKEGSFRKAKTIVDRHLKFRLRSEQELRDTLTTRNLPAPIIEQTIRHFKGLGLIDDRLFARQWTFSRLKKPFGLNRIRLELKKMGIDQKIIQDVTNETSQQYDELAIVTPLAQRRVQKYHDVEPEKIKQRIYGYLSRRGFNTDIILKAIKDI